MIGLGRGFGSDELPELDAAASADLAASLQIGHLLEATVATPALEPRADFVGRVMESVVAEPEAHPAGAIGRALRYRRPWGVVLGVRDAWRVAWAGAWPGALRLEAIAVVLVAVLALGSIGGTAVVGALSLLAPDGSPGPSPTLQPSPRPSPTPALSAPPSPSPAATPDATEPADPTETPDATETPEAEETPEASDDNSGPGGGGGPGGGDDSGSGGPGPG